METIPSTKDKSMRTALFLFAKISGWIAAPVVIALVVGKWLDRKWGTAPFLFLGLTAVAFIVSLVGIIRESKRSMREIEEEAAKRKEEKKEVSIEK